MSNFNFIVCVCDNFSFGRVYVGESPDDIIYNEWWREQRRQQQQNEKKHSIQVN